jgi:hypothetical protein
MSSIPYSVLEILDVFVLILSLVGGFLALFGACLKVRDSIDDFTSDLARQGRWIAWAAFFTLMAQFLQIVIRWSENGKF